MKTTPLLPFFSALLAVASVAGLSPKTEAAPVTIAITATVTQVGDVDNILGGQIVNGNIVTGFYRYDSAAVDQNGDANIGGYSFTLAPAGFELMVNGLSFRTDPDHGDVYMEMVNGVSGRDSYLARSRSNLFTISAPNGMFAPNNDITWQLDDPTQAVLSSDALPATPPVLADWEQPFALTLSSGGQGMYLVRAIVTSAVLVPEPSTALLLAGAGAALLLQRRRA